jgi:NAD(P)-dependent dehydrogenase (short-subunit alcohol dehydrogenase family)
VINVAAISGWMVQLAMSGPCGAAKAALIFDTEGWALEFVPHGVRVNTVSPRSILVSGNGWDRCHLGSQANHDDYVRHAFPWAVWAQQRKWPTSSSSLPHRGPIGSTAETFRSTAWSNPTRRPTVGRSEITPSKPRVAPPTANPRQARKRRCARKGSAPRP